MKQDQYVINGPSSTARDTGIPVPRQHFLERLWKTVNGNVSEKFLNEFCFPAGEIRCSRMNEKWIGTGRPGCVSESKRATVLTGT
jgi:hypothetical protein